jgi:hypothetical protein
MRSVYPISAPDGFIGPLTGNVTGDLVGAMTEGSGFTGTGTVYASSVQKMGDIIVTRILLDLTGLNSSAAGDIIGGNGEANCHMGQVTAAVNGTVVGGLMTCLEAPTGGEPDIDIYSAAEATGTEDAAISSLDETAVLEAAADWTIGAQKAFGTITADDYLYLVGSGGGTNATYTAGKFLIEFYGV